VSVDGWGFDVQRQATARRLRSLRIRLSAIRTAVVGAVTLALVLGGAGALRDRVLALPVPSWAAAITFLVVLFALVMGVDLPFRYVGGYRWERAFDLSSQRLRGWMKDLVKSLGLGLGSMVAAGLVLLWLLAVSPTWWWLAAWALGLAVSVVLAFIAPIVLVPMFYRFRPLDDPALRARFESLAARAHVPIVGVFELRASEKTRRSNAAVMGLGRTRRVVVTDTLLRDFRPEEVETVLAHELAHQKFLDPLRGFVLGSVTSLVTLAVAGSLYAILYPAFGMRSISDMAGLPLLAALLGLVSLPLQPLELSWSRAREARADRFSLELTHDAANFAGAMVKLHDQNLGVADPSPWEKWLFYSHPPGRERVELARSFHGSPA
jgi:STE24 endopeptidase